MSAFEEQQMEAIRAAQDLIADGNYYTAETNQAILERLIATLPPDIAAIFRENLVIDDTTEASDEVMYYSGEDGKIHVKSAMLRAMFINDDGSVKSREMFEVFVRHELRHRYYAAHQNPLSKAIHSIGKLEEFIASMGDMIYTIG
jgi:hypothetical protein